MIRIFSWGVCFPLSQLVASSWRAADADNIEAGGVAVRVDSARHEASLRDSEGLVRVRKVGWFSAVRRGAKELMVLLTNRSDQEEEER